VRGLRRAKPGATLFFPARVGYCVGDRQSAAGPLRTAKGSDCGGRRAIGSGPRLASRSVPVIRQPTAAAVAREPWRVQTVPTVQTCPTALHHTTGPRPMAEPAD
jgi:hypothetical protein